MPNWLRTGALVLMAAAALTACSGQVSTDGPSDSVGNGVIAGLGASSTPTAQPSSSAPAPSTPAAPQKCVATIHNHAYVIADMKVKETCYTVPWAMALDRSNGFWLSPGYDVVGESKAGGTRHMAITRIAADHFATQLDPSDDEEMYRPVMDASYYKQQGWFPVSVTEKK
jgi:hypothetical protein